MVGTTINKLKKDKCYCQKKQTDIKLEDCILFNCNRWNSCMKKTNSDINKDLKRREKNGKKVQKGKQTKKESKSGE